MDKPTQPADTFAFIDVQNTETTARQALGFEIDWMRLCEYLKNAWKCREIFLYVGIDEGDTEREVVFEGLKACGYLVRSKYTSTYRNIDRTVRMTCPKCKMDLEKKIYSGYNRKANCDVELAVDAMRQMTIGNTFIIFSGDGDFEYLIRTITESDAKVYIASSNAKIKHGNTWTRRLSEKLKRLTGEYKGRINLVDISDWKIHIQHP
jgi:uncharacterized LabA/DUF88 family protein